MNYNPLAQSLNAELSANGCCVLDMLSEQGKAIFFPRKGILGQGAEAKGSSPSIFRRLLSSMLRASVTRTSARLGRNWTSRRTRRSLPRSSATRS